MSDVSGNQVKEVRVSEATRRDSRGPTDRDTLLKALAELASERLAFQARCGQACARLSEIKHRIRGRYLPPEEYRAFGQEQTQLTRELKEIEAKLSESRLRKHRLEMDLNHAERPDKIKETNLLLRAILKELRQLNGKQPSAPAESK